MSLVRIPSADFDAPPVYLDPSDVVGIHPAGIPGCSVVARKSSFELIVQGAPDDVYATLTAAPKEEV
jgi:hypothetical protein